MKLPFDKITEAYFNQAGTEFGEKVRKRINWICQHAKGDHILDIGCSQGITSILLGREGKKVLGVDYLQESIDFANEQLLNEPEDVRDLVQFERANFITWHPKKDKYDVILLTEVLEHINQPDAFFLKAYNLLEFKGIIIVTVPFGINDFFDHKKTFYLYDLLGMVSSYINVSKIEFMGKWIGVVGTKKETLDSNADISINNDLVKRLESNFYEVERELVTSLKEWQIKHSDLRKENENLKKSLSSNNYEELINKKITALTEDFNSNYQGIKTEVEDLVNKLDAEVAEVVSSSAKIADTISYSLLEEKENKLGLKKEIHELLSRYEIILGQHKDISYKYQTLRNSKLGKITLWYWKFRKRINGGW
ncbi:methyltransferase domain-containing protein [Paenibacillus sp. 2KB_22]|uniref:class I SAM-dependent methyltransferase n=1 Tax=Paenibacillus sp. 2KB_22 TaxID=3232978 RepID=UPI003F9C5C42